MNPSHFETRLRRELRDQRAQPSPALRGRILDALAAAPHRSVQAPRADELTPATIRAFPRWICGLAACLVALVALRAVQSPAGQPEAAPAAPVAWTAELDDSAAQLESNLLAQADLMAEDARRAAANLLDRMPAAPWARRSDRR